MIKQRLSVPGFRVGPPNDGPGFREGASDDVPGFNVRESGPSSAGFGASGRIFDLSGNPYLSYADRRLQAESIWPTSSPRVRACQSPLAGVGLCTQGGTYGNGGVIPHPTQPGKFLCPDCALKLFDLDMSDPKVRDLLE